MLTIWEAIQLWQGWKRLGSLWGWITASPARIWAAIAIITLGYAAWQFRQAEDWAAKFRQLEADTRAASKQAATSQAAVNHQPAAISAAIAEQSNAKAPAYYRSVIAAADLHRVQSTCPRSAGAADLPGADHAAPVDDRPAPAPDMVSRPRADDDLLVAAAARAAQMHADAQALIAAGVAKASE